MYMKSTSLSKYTNQLAKESYVVNCQGDADSYNIQIMLVSKLNLIWFLVLNATFSNKLTMQYSR